MSTVSAPKVSIIVLTYNHEKFIKAALDSIEQQDYHPIQVVIGDDASQDSTNEVIDTFVSTSILEFKKNYFKENVGITKNLNKCLADCDGEFIFMLGGDDLFLPGKITAQVDFFQKNENVSICYHDVEVFESDSNKTLFYYNKLFGLFSGTTEILIERGAFNCGPSVAIRNDTKLPFCDERIRFASDWLWYVEILETTQGRIDYVSGVLARYRRHGGNVTGQSKMQQQYEETILALGIIDEKYQQLSPLVRRTRGERMIAFAIKNFIARNYSTAFSLFISAMRQDLISPFIFVKLRINRFFSAVRL